MSTSRSLFKLVLFLLVAGLLVITPAGLQARPLAADWTGWTYVENVRVRNNSAGSLPSGYTVDLSRDTAALISQGRMRADCADLRISYTGGGSDVELDRQVTGCNTASTQVRFKTQQAVLTGAQDGAYLLHYGNAGAGAPPANLQNVYDFYDDFQDGDAAGWTAAKGVWGVVNDGGNYVYRYTSGGATWAISYATLSNTSNLEILSDIRAAANTTWIGLAFRIQDPNNFLTFYESRDGSLLKYARVVLDDHGNPPATIGFTMAADTWYSLRVQAVGTAVRARIWQTGTAEPVIWTLSYTDSTYQTQSNFGATLYNHTTAADWDNIRVRRLVDVEPTVETYTPVAPISEWYFRAPIDIYNTSTTESLPVKFTGQVLIDTAALIADGRMSSNCQDLQVGAILGASVYEIDRIVENCNTASTRVWFALQRPVAPGAHDTGYYIYYGDPTLTTPMADGMKVFLFYEDWEQGAGHWINAGGLDTGNSGAGTGLMGQSVISNAQAISPAHSQLFPVKVAGGDAFSGYIPVSPNTTYAIGTWARSGENTYAPVGINRYTAGYGGGSEWWLWTNDWTIGPAWSWHSAQFTTASDVNFIKIKSEWWAEAPGAQPVYMDNLNLRYALASEPTFTLGDEETTLAAPVITNITGPASIGLGSAATVSAEVATTSGAIDAVTLRIVAPVPVDVPMSLQSGSTTTGVWQGSYTPDQGGTYTYRIRAHADNGLQTTSPQHTFTVTDTTPPVISNVTLTDPLNRNDTQTVTATVTDNGAVGSVSLTVGGVAHPMTRNGSQYSYSWQVTAPGSIPFTITALDTAGNPATQAGSFTVQLRPTEVCTWKDCKPAAASWSNDDSNSNCFNELAAAGFHGTFYVNGSAPQQWYTDYSAAGHEIGAHTVGHPCNGGCCQNPCTPDNLASCPYTQQEVDDYRSQQFDPNIASIETATGKPVLSGAWPCGCTGSGRMLAASFYFLGVRGYSDCGCTWVQDNNLPTPAWFMNLNGLHEYNQTYIDQAIAQGKWTAVTSHGSCVGIAYMGSRSDVLWNAPIGEVLKYIKVRNAAQFSNYSRSGQTISFDAIHSLPSMTREKLDGADLLSIVFDNPVSLKVLIDETDTVESVLVAGVPVPHQIKDVDGGHYVVFDTPLDTSRHVVVNLALPLPAIGAITDAGTVELGQEAQVNAVVTIRAGSITNVTLQVLTPVAADYPMAVVPGLPNTYTAGFTPGSLTNITYRIRAANDSGGSSLSAVHTLSVVDTTAPGWRLQAQGLDLLPQNRVNLLSVEGQDIGGLQWATLWTDESGAWQEFGFSGSNWWNVAWTHRLPVTVNETAGLARTNETVDITIPSSALSGLAACTNQLRVTDANKTEMPSQVYADNSGGVETCHLLFQATVGANASRTYYVYFGNPAATAPSYTTDLTAAAGATVTTVTSSYFDLDIDNDSAIISRLLLPQGSNTSLPLSSEGDYYWGLHQVCSSDGNISGKNRLCTAGTSATGLTLQSSLAGPLVREYTVTSAKTGATYTMTFRFLAGAPYYQYSLARTGTTAVVMNNFWFVNGNFNRLGYGTGGTPSTDYNTYTYAPDLLRIASSAPAAAASIDGSDNDGMSLGGADYNHPTASGLALNVVTGSTPAAVDATLARLAAPLAATPGAAEDAPQPVYGSPTVLQGASGWTGVSYPWTNPSLPVGRTVQWKVRFYDVSGNWIDTDVKSFQLEAPTAVTMAGWQATREGDRVLVEWSTALEIDLVGFNVYRAEGLTGLRTRLNTALIPSSGQMFGSEYRFSDDAVQPGKTYYYWIEWVGLDSAREVYGPAVAPWTTPLYLPLLLR